MWYYSNRSNIGKRLMETKELHFSISGEWLTDMVRKLYWYENKTYHHVEEILLSSLIPIDENHSSAEEMKNIVFDIIYGRKKLIGDSESGINIKEDNDPIAIKSLEQIRNKYNTLNNSNKDIINKYNNFIEWLTDNDYEYLIKRFQKESKIAIIENYEDNDSCQDTVNSFLEQAHIEKEYDNNYGWLDPRGNFYPVDWGNHQTWAYHKLKEINSDAVNNMIRCYNAGDYLIEEGWILLHNPALGIAKPTCSPNKHITKAQKEFLYDYYIERNINPDRYIPNK